MEQTAKPVWGTAAEQFRKYRHDYLAGLAVHSFVWTVVTFAPILWLASWWAALLIVVPNMAFHWVVDDFKANRYRLTLWQDQLLHLAQIGITLGVWYACI